MSRFEQLNTDFQDYFEEYSVPESFAALSDEEVAQLPLALPADLLQFLREVGRCVLPPGRTQFCHPDDMRPALSLVFGNDQTFTTSNCFGYGYSPFGDIFCWHQAYGLIYVSLLSGKIMQLRNDPIDEADLRAQSSFFSAFTMPEEEEHYDIHDEPLFERAAEHLGPLEIGECYGFFPMLALHDAPLLESLRRVKAREHFALLAQATDFIVEGSGVNGGAGAVRRIGEPWQD